MGALETMDATTPTTVPAEHDAGADVPALLTGAVSRPALWDILTALLAVLFVAATGWTAAYDPDLYWHIVLGHSLLTHWWSGADPIAFTAALPWRPEAWLAEVGYSALVSAFGYAGILGLRLVLEVCFVGALLWALRRGRPAWVATVVFAAVALPGLFYLQQDRPQTISFVLLVPVGVWLLRGLQGVDPPRWWVVAGYTWLWANIHGMWVMVPVVCLLLMVARLLDAGRDGVPQAVAWLLRGVAAVVAAALTPMGPWVVLAPLRLGAATKTITEWGPTTTAVLMTWSLILVLLLLVVGWARGARRGSWGELLAVTALALFATNAERNVVVSAVLLAPLAAETLAGFSPPRWLGTQRTVPRAAVAVVAVLAVTATAYTYGQDRVINPRDPAHIAATLAAQHRPLRVLNDYNVSGFIRDFGGNGVRVAVDGRADRYGGPALAAYSSMMAGQGSWQEQVAALRANAAVLLSTSALAGLLASQDDWVQLQTDGRWVLLVPPGTAPAWTHVVS